MLAPSKHGMPTCFLHIGTHKTGTSALQMMLANEKSSFAEELFVPRCGRLPPELSGGGAGHHNIAWELNHDPRFDPSHGVLDELMREIAERRAQNVVVSSEDFEYLHVRPEAIERLASAFAAIGYDVRVLLYVRSRAVYIASLYAELVKHGLTRDFSSFMEEIVEKGVFVFAERWVFRFEYELLAARFATVFGAERIIVRPYVTGQGGCALARDFLSVVTGRTYDALQDVMNRNASLSLLAVLDFLHANVRKEGVPEPEPKPRELAAEIFSTDEYEVLEQKYNPLDQDDVMRILSRFKQDDELLASRYGVRIPHEFEDNVNQGNTVQKRLMVAAAMRWGILSLTEARKDFGVRYARAGDFEEAMKYLQAAVSSANAEGEPEIDATLAMLAREWNSPSRIPLGPFPSRIALLTSALLDEHSPKTVTLSLLEGLRDAGYEVSVVSAEDGKSGESKALVHCEERGFPVRLASNDGTFRDRISGILRIFEEHPVHATLYMTSPSDVVMKVISEIGVSSTQFFVHSGYEPHCGRFDYIFQSVSRDQETATCWPGKSKYVGRFIALAPEIDKALPFNRAELEVPEDAFLLATFGRIEKCSPEYIATVRTILENEQRAVLLLAGMGSEREYDALRVALRANALEQRVRVLVGHQHDVPELLKATDLYLDTFPKPDGQSLLEAMHAGTPVVAMRSISTSALLPVNTELARNSEEYERMALAYLHAEKKRRVDGAALRHFALERYSLAEYVGAVDYYVRKAMSRIKYS